MQLCRPSAIHRVVTPWGDPCIANRNQFVAAQQKILAILKSAYILRVMLQCSICL